jgi:hypothetical protein
MKTNAGLTAICLVIILNASCGKVQTDPEALAKRHCSSCHVFPDPSLLDKQTWKSGVLPEMAFRMGRDLSNLQHIDPVEHPQVLGTIPEPQLTDEEWNKIREYYLSLAPDSLTLPRENIVSTLSHFTPSIVTLPVRSRTLLTLIKHDSLNDRIYVGTRRGNLYLLDNDFVLTDSLQLSSAPSEMILDEAQKPILACMGIMDPNDQAAGSIIRLNTPVESYHTLIDSLKRPVDVQQADLNNDGQQDLIVSAFGNFTGGLYAFQKRNNTYLPFQLHNFSGNRKTVVRDFNADGLADIMTLITQGDERIALFTNRGNFRFSFQVLLKFPPVYGSSYFEICDFNDDGYPDILLTNGDNADYSPVLKPFHGVRIFLNDGGNQFTESWFHQMHGASRAHAHDFDQDGDLDIAAISFFPDFDLHPEHGFIYFENQGGKLVPQATGLSASARWITMEPADFDSDGDTDLILGALTFPNGVPDSLFQVWKEQPASLLVLRNNLR